MRNRDEYVAIADVFGANQLPSSGDIVVDSSSPLYPTYQVKEVIEEKNKEDEPERMHNCAICRVVFHGYVANKDELDEVLDEAIEYNISTISKEGKLNHGK